MGLLNSKPVEPPKEPKPILDKFQYHNKSIVSDGYHVFQQLCDQRICIYQDDCDATGKRWIVTHSFVETIINGQTLIIKYTENEKHNYMTYYDKSLNHVRTEIKDTTHQNPWHVYLLDENKYLYREKHVLRLYDIKKESSTWLFESSNLYNFKITENKDIVLCYGFQLRLGSDEITFSIRIFRAENNYAWTNDDKTYTMTTPHIYCNFLFLYMLPENIVHYYNNLHFYIREVYENKETFIVIHSCLDKVTVDEWVKDSHKLRRTLLHGITRENLHLINKLLNKSFLFFHYQTPIGSILPEFYTEWKKRMILLLSEITVLRAFSADMLNLFIEFVD